MQNTHSYIQDEGEKKQALSLKCKVQTLLISFKECEIYYMKVGAMTQD